MNFSEISNDIRQSLRSESVAPAQAKVRAPARDAESETAPLAVNRSGENALANRPHTLSKDEATALAADIEKVLEANNVKLKFNIIEENDTVQVEIVNNEGKTIRKIPSDDMIKLSKSLESLDRGFIDARS
ncbi:MAG: flagellar protein FlaG [Pseudodesulfovibrio sp.]|uniref:Flagellar protein FlaG protein n=1 Tax=Pseudodesulfovibrio aespoeensis (strain ATCC 700646 / DSM 10631 / Aspo-2) TaxID=643562 RepID=E6VXY1_PSEA9|nr:MULTISPECIES: flagellar protein FlaG [Pseudodesulfovibrio]MBU4191921.1 flagellar protein FlaG [Pseudomonadota bacterium]ADU62688.1 flagellar protein FlaG protein [Pseudodesulfovibrio aespoeensis Aspo-2]MBU4380010.1 flagellar protein FlaG [Pseudomonadota bacterium]MBU4474337.1 flagellar protein FlaG [Pseudomonadota bacterium]MBU4515625.1 flagellar protein FlaG [Pseudomonadota bacterium]